MYAPERNVSVIVVTALPSATSCPATVGLGPTLRTVTGWKSATSSSATLRLVEVNEP